MLARVLRAVREHDLPDRQRDDERVQPHDPDEDPVDETHECPEADADEDPDGQSAVGADAHADEHVPAEGDHAGGREVDTRLHDDEHLPDRSDGEDRPVREDVRPRRALERAGCEERGDDDERGHSEPDGEEASPDECARDDLRGASHRRGVGDGIPVTRGAHGPLDPERQNGEEPAATRCPFCAPRARSVNRDRTHAARRPSDSNVAKRELTPRQTRSSRGNVPTRSG